MKRRIFLILLLLALVLSACSKGPVRTVEYRDMTFTLDTENQTITQDGDVYRYEIDRGNSGITYTITYPDHAVYTMTWSGNIGTGSSNVLYDKTSCLDADILIGILRDELPKEKLPGSLFLSLLCIGLGIFNAAAPKAACYLSRGWRYKNAEPTEAYLALTRISGIIMVIAGLLVLFIP